MPPGAHTSAIEDIAIAEDGTWFASAGDDQTVRIWSLPAGVHLRTFAVPGARCVAIQPHTRVLAICHRDGVRLIDVQTGTTEREYVMSSALTSAAWSADGRTLVLAASAGLFKVSDGKGEPVPVFSAAFVKQLAFSRDGALLFVRSDIPGRIQIVRADTWQAIPSADLDAFAPGAMAVSHSQAELAVANAKGEVRRWSMASQSWLGGAVTLDKPAERLAYISDNELLVDAGLELLTVTFDPPHARAVEERRPRAVSFLQSGPRGALIAGCAGGEILLWPAGLTDPVTELSVQRVRIGNVRFRRQGLLFSVREDSSFADGGVWAIQKGVSVTDLNDRPWVVFDTWRGKAGTWVAAGGNGSLWIRDIAAPERDGELLSFDGTVQDVSPDGRLAVLRREGTAPRDSAAIRNLESGSERTIAGGISKTVELVFTPKTNVLVGLEVVSGTLDVFDLSTGRRLRRIDPHIKAPGALLPGLISAYAFSADGRRVATAHADGAIRVWTIGDGRLERTLPLGRAVHGIAFTPDGQSLAVGFNDDASEILELRTGRKMLLEDGLSDVSGFSFDPQGRIVVTSTALGLIAFHDWDDGRLLGTLAIQRADGGWMAFTPDGLFDGIDTVWARARWRVDGATFDSLPVEMYLHEYFYPGVLSEILEKHFPSPSRSLSSVNRQTPTLTLSTRLRGPYTARSVPVTIRVSGSEPANDLRLFRNGTLVRTWRGPVTAPEMTADVPIVAGTNTFSAYAFNAENVRSETAHLEIAGEQTIARPGELYVLAVGVNDYGNDEFKLNFAAADAETLASYLSRGRQQISEFTAGLAGSYAAAQRSGKAVSESTLDRLKRFTSTSGPAHVTVLVSPDATKKTILNSIAEIGARARPEDAVVIFFAGHGTAVDQRYYLLPQDLGYSGPRSKIQEQGLALVRANGISDLELETALEPIDAAVVALIIDACESGQVLDAATDWRRGPINSRGLAQLAYEKGMYVLAAAQSYGSALEDQRLGHGLLTYSLTRGSLGEGSPLLNQSLTDGVSLDQWLEFTARRLATTRPDTGLAQRPQRTVDIPTAAQEPRFGRPRESASTPVLVTLLAIDPVGSR